MTHKVAVSESTVIKQLPDENNGYNDASYGHNSKSNNNVGDFELAFICIGRNHSKLFSIYIHTYI